MASPANGVTRQRTVAGQYVDEEKLVSGPQDMAFTRENSLPFWQRFRGVGRKKVGVVESLKAIATSSCKSPRKKKVHIFRRSDCDALSQG
jgi:hypothetical protein